MLNDLHPNADQIRSFSDRAKDKPIAMLNLLRFKEKAEYEDARPCDLSGKQAYEKYAKAFRDIMAPKGVKVLFAGNIEGLLIGKGDQQWDEVAIIQYPSTQVMLDMMRNEEYQKAMPHRVAGLEGQMLMDCEASDAAF